MSLPGVDKKLTVCCYIGTETPRKSLKVIDQLLNLPSVGKSWDLLFALDAPAYDVSYLCAQEHKKSGKAVFMEGKAAFGKAQWHRVMLANIRSEYVLLVDDTINPSPSCIESILNYIKANPELEACAFKHEDASSSSPDGQRPLPIPKDGPILLKTSAYREFESNQINEAEKIAHRLSYFDFAMAAELGVFPENLKGASMRTLFFDHPIMPRDASIDQAKPLISIALCSYGHHPELVLRCLDSIIKEPFIGNHVEILIGCNQVSDEVMIEIERRCSNEPITAIIRSPLNFNKSGMQRFLYRMARAPYILSLDDDMYFRFGWLAAAKEHIAHSHPFEVAGRLHSLSNRTWWSGKKKPYDSFCEKKHWWRGKRPFGLEVVFPAGQCFLARTAFLLENDYPDLDMRIDWDDVLLGDMVTQLDGQLIWFEGPLMERVIVDDIPSRGQHGGG